MPWGGGVAKLPCVTHEVNLRISCAVDGDQIQGEVSDGVGVARPFRGWLSLIAAVDALLTQGDSPGEETPQGLVDAALKIEPVVPTQEA